MVKRFRYFIVLVAVLAPQSFAAPASWNEPLTGMRFIQIPKGCFRMGTREAIKPLDMAAWTNAGFHGKLEADEQPQHEVCVDAFMIGQHEVRASDWERVMGEAPPQGSGGTPASGVTWTQAKRFAERLTEQTRQAGAKHHFRLPTEAEWEYACRAGAKKEDVPARREDRKEVAWYAEQRAPRPREVGRRKANPWGLQDILGNVWEWTEDAYRVDAYTRHTLYNPIVSEAPGGERVIRGASHRSDHLQVRCGNRSSYPENMTLDQIGLRLVRTR